MNINTNTIIAIIAAIAIIIGGLFLFQRGNTEQTDEATEETETVSDDAVPNDTNDMGTDEDTPVSSSGSDLEEKASSDTTDGTPDTTSSGGDTQEESEPVSTETPAPDSTGDVEETVVSTTTIVTYTNSGFSPSSVTINAGEVVMFVNEGSNLMWPASAIHPTHTVYPGSSIQKCGTAEEDSIFDACSRVTSGNSWSFTFTETGTWKYHNHLNIGKTGTIVVE